MADGSLSVRGSRSRWFSRRAPSAGSAAYVDALQSASDPGGTLSDKGRGETHSLTHSLTLGLRPQTHPTPEYEQLQNPDVLDMYFLMLYNLPLFLCIRFLLDLNLSLIHI